MVTADTESFLSFLQVMPGMAATVTRNPVSWSESWGSCFPGPTLFPPENRAADGRLQPLKGDPHQSLVPREVAPREAPPPPACLGLGEGGAAPVVRPPFQPFTGSIQTGSRQHWLGGHGRLNKLSWAA